MIVALVALVAAFAGESVADVAIKALTKKEKKRTKKLARKMADKQINRRAPGLAVASSVNATNATNANTANAANAADIADTAGTANTAGNADALGGVSLGNLNPVAQGYDAVCDPPLTGGFAPCSGSAALALGRRADVLVMVTATWFDNDAGGVQAECAILRTSPSSVFFSESRYEYGTLDDDTDTNQERALAINVVDTNEPPGTHTYSLACDESEADFQLEDVKTIAVAVGS